MTKFKQRNSSKQYLHWSLTKLRLKLRCGNATENSYLHKMDLYLEKKKKV